jgi:two-component system, NtrC family, response regulator AtoC
VTRSEETETYARSDDADEALVLVALFAERNEVWTLPRRGKVTLGRAHTCDVVVDDPTVAQLHAVLELGPRVVVRRKASGAETRVEGLSLGDGESAELAVGAVVDLGQASLLLQRRGGAPSPGGQALSFGDHDALVGGALATTYDVVRRAAAGDLSVLVLGETGVGKDLVAELVHRLSPRAAGPFVRVHCAALAASLFESELFGHERGAFTGAVHAKPGLVELADGGTLMLDEVGEIPLAMQVKLLRVLEDRRVTRLGSSSPVTVDVRFVAATNRDLLDDVERGRFRRDLYYRLSGLTVTVPPLRERRAEILPLAELFLARSSRPALTFGEDARHLLATHPFPGNVRELRLAVERAAALAAGETIAAADLALEGAEPGASSVEALLRALGETAGNQSEAARRLGISRRTLVTRLAEIRASRAQ